MNVLVDTSVIIDFLRRKDKENTLLYKTAKSGKHLHISLITHAELYSGRGVWENEKMRVKLEDLLSGISILPFEKDISINAGQIRVKHSLEIEDAIIAATALENNLVLVTLNKKDFKKIKGLKLI